jgi:hypothetical protein
MCYNSKILPEKNYTPNIVSLSNKGYSHNLDTLRCSLRISIRFSIFLSR